MSLQKESAIQFHSREITLRLGTLDANQRLDRFLRKLLPGAKLGFLHKIIDRGRVRVNREKSTPRAILEPGDVVRLPFSREQWHRLALSSRDSGIQQPSTSPLPDILVEDQDVLAVNKPAALAVHGAGASLTTRVKGYLEVPGGALTFRLAPAHRLDRHTSGVVLFGKTPDAQRGLAASFRNREVTKVYLALAAGELTSNGVLKGGLERMNRPRGAKVRVGTGGVWAETRYRVLNSGPEASLLEVRPLTGRTHQIRAHLSNLGHPVVGDPRYSGKSGPALCRRLGLSRMFLHALRLEIPHPGRGDLQVYEAPIPVELRAALKILGFQKFRERLEGDGAGP